MIPRLAPVSPQLIPATSRRRCSGCRSRTDRSDPAAGPVRGFVPIQALVMDVKLVARTLDLFELFAAERRPLPLTELARLLNVPASSCRDGAHAREPRLPVRSAQARRLPPTRRLQTVAAAIDGDRPGRRHRPSASRRAARREPRDGRARQDPGVAVTYLDVVESEQAIRYTRAPGELRPLHANSIGKAIFAELAGDAQQALGAQLPFERFTDATVADPPALVAQTTRFRELGWAENFGESAPGVGDRGCIDARRRLVRAVGGRADRADSPASRHACGAARRREGHPAGRARAAESGQGAAAQRAVRRRSCSGRSP